MTVEKLKAKQESMSNEALIGFAEEQVSVLAKTGGKSHRMCVPPKITDTDMLFSELIKRFKKANESGLKTQELIHAQDDYIKFLGKELGRHESMTVVRPYMAASSDKIRQGIECRNKIALLKAKIK